MELIEFDHELLLFINGIHTEYLDSLMWLISGKTVWIPFYVSVLYMVWRNRGWNGMTQLLLLVGIMMLFTDMLNSQVIRPFFHRLRPANLDSPVGTMVHIVNDYRGGTYGFPSAHAANYWGLSLLIFYFTRSRRLLASLTILTLIVCYSRSYLGVHYPGDLAAGIIYATMSVALIIFGYEMLLKQLSLRKGTDYRAIYSKEARNTRYDWLPGVAALLTICVFAIIAGTQSIA